MKTWKNNLGETKQRYLDWWKGKGVILNMWEHFQEGVTPHANIPKPTDARDNNQRWFDPKWRAEYLDWYVAHSCLKADMLPVANTQLGPGSLAAILGARYEGGDDTIWIHPDPEYTDDFEFDPNHPNYILHKQLLQACKAKAQGHYYVGMPDLMEGLDVLAAMKGTDKVLLDLAMQPEVVERQMQKINDIYFRVFDELYDIIREGDEMAFCYFSAWAPGKMTKLQCDISTMISTEDYRRFVQPFIREQCQKIPYTLYHLDGVGAMHHLPALLEIEELNAIQWTPGVGEPQGGSSKWYELYRKILNAGKSVMACHLTVDEIKPLLNNIGTEGVHLEVDFQNEKEVEEAMKIIENFKHSDCCCGNQHVEREGLLNPQVRSIEEEMDKRILVLDGAQGTTIQQYKLSEEQYRGRSFADFNGELKGCNDLLNITNPGICADVHRRFCEAGADILTTHTFNAQRISLGGFKLAHKVHDINIAACAIAKAVASMYSTPEKPIFVAGGVGPTSKCISLNDISKEELFEAYYEQISALVEGGVDCLLIETIFDTANALTALEAYKKTGSKIPVIMSFTIKDPKGFNMLGQDLLQFMLSLKDEPIMAVGLNCSLGAEQMMPFLRKIAANVPQKVIAFPNAGLPDKDGKYEQTPKKMQKVVWPLIDEHLVNIIGGCCGTDDSHIREIAKLVKVDDGLFVSPRRGVVKEVITETPDIPETSETSDSPEVLTQAIVKGKAPEAIEATKELVEKGEDPQTIINTKMVTAMSEIGRQFEEGTAFVPQLLMAARAMKAALEILKPLMAGKETTSLGKVIIGTVKGDLHDIGKNLVASMLEGCGFEVFNIGVDVTAEKFVEEIKAHDADILCMSALLTTTMTYMPEVIRAIEDAGLRRRVKIMIGGAPLSQEFSDEIHADGYSDNANAAVALAKQLMGK